MQDVLIRFKKGSMAGQIFQHTVGSLAIGREPQQEPGQESLVLVGAGDAVSRTHMLLLDDSGEMIVRNIGANGTKVNGKLVTESEKIESGATIAIGKHHEFSVSWQLVGGRKVTKQKSEDIESVASSGMLGSPMVRAILGFYILSMVAVAAYLSIAAGSGSKYDDDWPELSAAYEDYQPANLTMDEKANRAEKAKSTLIQLRVLHMNDMDDDIKLLCRKLMHIDSDIHSPIYQYGAKCLGNVN
ncbi:MAG: FHA domain-containing protein [Halioglobus sp.]